jgi:hypothetical protein
VLTQTPTKLFKKKQYKFTSTEYEYDTLRNIGFFPAQAHDKREIAQLLLKIYKRL